MTTDARPPMHLAGRDLGQHRHVCAFFNSDEEELQTLLPFVSDGIAAGDKAFHIVDPDMRDEYLRRLGAGGVDVSETVEAGQLEVRVWEEIHLKPGYFSQAAMLELIQEVLRSGKQQGYSLTRFIAHMEWCLRDCPGVEDIVEYEARLNYVLPEFDDVVICTYDIARHRSDVIMGVLRTHPVVILGGMMHANPFYIPPDQFLAELRDRKSKPSTAPT